jgi:hypothetical protein
MGHAVTVGDARAGIQHTQCGYGDVSKTQVFLTFRSFDINALTMTVDASMCVPPSQLANFYVHGVPAVTQDPVTTFYMVDPHASDAPVWLEFQNLTNGQPHIFTTTLGKLAGTEDFPPVSLGSMVIPVADARTRYPLDWYQFRGAFRVAVIGGVLVHAPPGPNNPGGAYFPFDIVLLRSPDLFDARASILSGNAADRFSSEVDLQLTRSGLTRSYVLIVALIPLLLAALISITMFIGRTTENRVGPESLVAVTAALLAILPIHAVLVPPNIGDFTLVDYALGFEMAVLAAIACAGVARALWVSSAATAGGQNAPPARPSDSS